MPLAWDLYKAKSEVDKLEWKLSEVLEESGIKYDDWWVDDYDGSIEITGCADLTAEQQAALWAAGFDRAWSHPGSEQVGEVEKYYVAPATAAAVPKST